MNLKFRLLFLLLLFAHICNANMSSPYVEGTKTAAAFSSKDINILSETIFIRIDKDYQTAKFIVEYTIKNDSSSFQIPLLFFAKDYKDDFSVWLDNEIVAIQNIPNKYVHFDNSPFSGFENLTNGNRHNEGDEVSIYWTKNVGNIYSINDLKYFETDINKGTHKVRVEYTANVWTDNSNWIKEYSFRYSLSPAKFWKSFGSLSITIEQEGIPKPIITNLGLPIEKGIKQKNTWEFNELPAEYIDITFIPKPNKIARIFLHIEPFGIALFIGLVLVVLHILIVKYYRKRNLQKKYSVIVIIGSIIIPFIVCLCYILSFDFIDNLIGIDASRHHGYVFLIIVLYPIIMPIYWTVLWLIDRGIKNKLINNQKSSH